MRTQLAAGAGQLAARALRAVGRACRTRGARAPLGTLRRVPGWERARDILRGVYGRMWRAALGARVILAAVSGRVGVAARVILERGAALGAPGGAGGCVCPDSSPRGAGRRVAGAGGMSAGEWSGELAGELEGRGGVDRGRGVRGAAGDRARGSARGATGRACRGGGGAPEYRTGLDSPRSGMGCCRGDNNRCCHPDKNPVVVTLTTTRTAPPSDSPRLSSDSTVAAPRLAPHHADAAGGTLLATAHGRQA